MAGLINRFEKFIGIDLNRDGHVGGDGGAMLFRDYSEEDKSFPGLVKSRRRKLGQSLGGAITARSFRTASAVSVHADLHAAVNEAITNVTATILKGMEEPDYVFIACTNNHSLNDAMCAVRDIWQKPCLHGVTSCQGLAANSGVSGTQQHETFSMGLFVICDESPYSLYDVVGVECTNMATFTKEVEEQTRGFFNHSLKGQRHENWKEMVGTWLSCTPTQEEPVQAAINEALGEYTSIVPVCGGTAAPNSMAFPFVDSHVGYAASMSEPHVFSGGTPADGGMVLSVMHTSCRVKPIFNNFFTPVTWAHGRATVDAQGTITKIGGRNATEVYREWLTRVEGRDPLPPNTEPDDFSMVPQVLVATAQRPIAIRLSYTSEHSNDFITCPPLNLSRDGLKVVLDLKHFMQEAKDPEDIELYLMRVTDASLLRSLRRQQNHDVAGMLGVLCCTKMLDLKYSVMGAARLEEVNREISVSVRHSPFLVYFPLGEHGFIENRKRSAHGKLMSSFMLFCRDTGQDVEDLVTLLLSAEEAPAPESPLQSDFRQPWTRLASTKSRLAVPPINPQEPKRVEPSPEGDGGEGAMSSYHYYSLQAKQAAEKAKAEKGMPSGPQPGSYREKRTAGRAESGDMRESFMSGVSGHSFHGTASHASKHHLIQHEDKKKEHEQLRIRKRHCGHTIMAMLSQSPPANDLTKEMVAAFCDLLGAGCLQDLVLSSRCCLRLCFLIEYRLLELAADKRNVRTREWIELSEKFGQIPWEVVEIGEKNFGLQLMEDLLANDEKLWTDTYVTHSFQDFLTHPTCRTQVITMWDGPRVKSSSGYSANAVHKLHMISHVAYIACLVPSLFYLDVALAGALAAYRLMTVIDDWHFTRGRYNEAYTQIGMLVVVAIVVRAVLVSTHADWTHIPNICIVIMEGLAMFRFTIQQEYLGTLQLAILRIGAEFYRFGVLVTALILLSASIMVAAYEVAASASIMVAATLGARKLLEEHSSRTEPGRTPAHQVFAMALTVNAQGRDIPAVPAGTEEGGGRKASEWFPGQFGEVNSGTEFGQWLLELFLLVIFGADPRSMLVLDAEEWGGWARLLCMMLLYCTFGAFSIVVLLNVLIAMCMSAYENVQKRREAEWQTLVFELARDYQRRPLVPPGFGVVFKRLFPQRAHWDWVRYILPGGRKLLEEHSSRTELKQARAEARLSLFLDLVTSKMHEDESKPKPATQAGLDSLRWQIENLQQVCCALQDQIDDESKLRATAATAPPSSLPCIAPEEVLATLVQEAAAATGARGGEGDAGVGGGGGAQAGASGQIVEIEA